MILDFSLKLILEIIRFIVSWVSLSGISFKFLTSSSFLVLLVCSLELDFLRLNFGGLGPKLTSFVVIDFDLASVIVFVVDLAQFRGKLMQSLQIFLKLEKL